MFFSKRITWLNRWFHPLPTPKTPEVCIVNCTIPVRWLWPSGTPVAGRSSWRSPCPWRWAKQTIGLSESVDVCVFWWLEKNNLLFSRVLQKWDNILRQTFKKSLWISFLCIFVNLHDCRSSHISLRGPLITTQTSDCQGRKGIKVTEFAITFDMTRRCIVSNSSDWSLIQAYHHV